MVNRPAERDSDLMWVVTRLARGYSRPASLFVQASEF